MTTTQFKPGDWVRRIGPSDTHYGVIKGSIYTVGSCHNGWLHLVGVGNAWMQDRFELVEPSGPAEPSESKITIARKPVETPITDVKVDGAPVAWPTGRGGIRLGVSDLTPDEVDEFADALKQLAEQVRHA